MDYYRASSLKQLSAGTHAPVHVDMSLHSDNFSDSNQPAQCYMLSREVIHTNFNLWFDQSGPQTHHQLHLRQAR